MLDLKGSDPRLSDAVLRRIEPFLGARGVTVCGRSSPLLDRFEDVPGVTVFYSAATPAELLGLLARDQPLIGLSVREEFLNPAIVRLVRRCAETVAAWTVNSRTRAQELTAIGVDAILTDDMSLFDGTIELRPAA